MVIWVKYFQIEITMETCSKRVYLELLVEY